MSYLFFPLVEALFPLLWKREPCRSPVSYSAAPFSTFPQPLFSPHPRLNFSCFFQFGGCYRCLLRAFAVFPISSTRFPLLFPLETGRVKLGFPLRCLDFSGFHKIHSPYYYDYDIHSFIHPFLQPASGRPAPAGMTHDIPPQDPTIPPSTKKETL